MYRSCLVTLLPILYPLFTVDLHTISLQWADSYSTWGQRTWMWIKHVKCSRCMFTMYMYSICIVNCWWGAWATVHEDKAHGCEKKTKILSACSQCTLFNVGEEHERRGLMALYSTQWTTLSCSLYLMVTDDYFCWYCMFNIIYKAWWWIMQFIDQWCHWCHLWND